MTVISCRSGGTKPRSLGLAVAAAAITKPSVAAQIQSILERFAGTVMPHSSTDEAAASLLKVGFFQADESMQQVLNPLLD